MAEALPEGESMGYSLPLCEYVDDDDFVLNPDGTPRTPGKDIEHLIINASKKISEIKLEDEEMPVVVPIPSGSKPLGQQPAPAPAPAPAPPRNDDAIFAVPRIPAKRMVRASDAAKKSVGRPRKTIAKPTKNKVLPFAVAAATAAVGETQAATWEQLIGPFETPFVSPKVKASNIVRRHKQAAAESLNLKIKEEVDVDVDVDVKPPKFKSGQTPLHEWYDPSKLIKEEFTTSTSSLPGLMGTSKPGTSKLPEIKTEIKTEIKAEIKTEIKSEAVEAVSIKTEPTALQQEVGGCKPKIRGSKKQSKIKSYPKEEPRSKFYREVPMGNGRVVKATFIAPRGVRFPDEINTAEIEEWHENYPKHMGGKKSLSKARGRKAK